MPSSITPSTSPVNGTGVGARDDGLAGDGLTGGEVGDRVRPLRSRRRVGGAETAGDGGSPSDAPCERRDASRPVRPDDAAVAAPWSFPLRA